MKWSLTISNQYCLYNYNFADKCSILNHWSRKTTPVLDCRHPTSLWISPAQQLRSPLIALRDGLLFPAGNQRYVNYPWVLALSPGYSMWNWEWPGNEATKFQHVWYTYCIWISNCLQPGGAVVMRCARLCQIVKESFRIVWESSICLQSDLPQLCSL